MECVSSVYRLHETFDCLDNAGHFGPHEGESAFGPCDDCKGLLIHTPDCSHSGEPIKPPGVLRPIRWTGTGKNAILLTFRT